MSSHPLKHLIQAADRAITLEDYDELMKFYADDACLVIKPGMHAVGKDQIRRAFAAIADHFNHSIEVKQGEMVVLGGGDVALVIMETVLSYRTASGSTETATRRATYAFKQGETGEWLCVIDNSYGTDLLNSQEQAA